MGAFGKRVGAMLRRTGYFFVGIWHQLSPFINTVAKQAFDILKEDGLDIIKSVILEVKVMPNLTWDERRDVAGKLIRDRFEAIGKEYTNWAVNLFQEIYYKKFGE